MSMFCPGKSNLSQAFGYAFILSRQSSQQTYICRVPYCILVMPLFCQGKTSRLTMFIANYVHDIFWLLCSTNFRKGCIMFMTKCIMLMYYVPNLLFYCIWQCLNWCIMFHQLNVDSMDVCWCVLMWKLLPLSMYVVVYRCGA